MRPEDRVKSADLEYSRPQKLDVTPFTVVAKYSNNYGAR
jgi:hypothetical protein